MKKRISAIVILAVSLLSVAYCAWTSFRNRAVRAEAEGLRQEVAKLQKEVTALQSQGLSSGQTAQYANRFVPSAPTGGTIQIPVWPNRGTVEVPPVRNGGAPFSQKQAEIPKGWVPFEFNGMTYYRIPLAEAGK
jgi:hypothetical protein